MSTTHVIALIVAVAGPFLLIVGLDLILTLASRRDFREPPLDENARPERD